MPPSWHDASGAQGHGAQVATSAATNPCRSLNTYRIPRVTVTPPPHPENVVVRICSKNRSSYTYNWVRVRYNALIAPLNERRLMVQDPFPEPGPDGEEPGSSPLPPEAEGTGPGDDWE